MIVHKAMFRGACAAALVALGSLAFAASETYDFEVVNASFTSAVSLTSSKLTMPSGSAPPCGALLTVETNSIRFRTDGTAPTNSVGHQITAGNSFIIDSWNDLRSLKMIGVTSTGTVNVSYWRGCR